MSGDREPRENKQSFWTTLPGVITAVAGLITALTGLLGALYSVGIIGDHGDATPTERPPTQAVTPTFAPQAETSISLSKSSGPPGTQLTISGKGFTPGETVVIRFHTQEVDRVQTDGQGEFSNVAVQVPPDWQFTGQFDFVASGLTSLRFASKPFQVT